MSRVIRQSITREESHKNVPSAAFCGESFDPGCIGVSSGFVRSRASWSLSRADILSSTAAVEQGCCGDGE